MKVLQYFVFFLIIYAAICESKRTIAGLAVHGILIEYFAQYSPKIDVLCFGKKGGPSERIAEEILQHVNWWMEERHAQMVNLFEFRKCSPVHWFNFLQTRTNQLKMSSYTFNARNRRSNKSDSSVSVVEIDPDLNKSHATSFHQKCFL